MQFAQLDGVTIHYSEDGEQAGVPIVFSNSLGTDFRIWAEMMGALAAAAPGRFRFIRYDKRGHGLSDAPPAPYSMGDHIGDLNDLLELADVGPAVVVGLSVGGMIAQGLAHHHPDKVRALVLCDTAHRIGDEAMWNERIDTVTTKGIDAMADAVMERWFSPLFRSTRQVELAGYRNMLTRTPVDGYAGTGAAIRDCDLGETTAKLKVPTLLLVGSNDGATPPDLVQSTHELIDGSRFEVMDGPGHLPCVESPAETAALVISFLRENSIV